VEAIVLRGDVKKKPELLSGIGIGSLKQGLVFC
jgi:hypothetical protein